MIEIQLKGDIEIINSLSKAGVSFSVITEECLDDAASKVVNELKSAVPLGSLGGGGLRSSIMVTKSEKGKRTIGAGGPSGSRSFPLPPIYSEYVERGNAAHFPNYTDLAMRTGLDPKRAYAVAKRISERSYSGRYPFLQTALGASEILKESAFNVINIIVGQ